MKHVIVRQTPVRELRGRLADPVSGFATSQFTSNHEVRPSSRPPISQGIMAIIIPYRSIAFQFYSSTDNIDRTARTQSDALVESYERDPIEGNSTTQSPICGTYPETHARQLLRRASTLFHRRSTFSSPLCFDSL